MLRITTAVRPLGGDDWRTQARKQAEEAREEQMAVRQARTSELAREAAVDRQDALVEVLDKLGPGQVAEVRGAGAEESAAR